jgi:hypothetical protein
VAWPWLTIRHVKVAASAAKQFGKKKNDNETSAVFRSAFLVGILADVFWLAILSAFLVSILLVKNSLIIFYSDQKVKRLQNKQIKENSSRI